MTQLKIFMLVRDVILIIADDRLHAPRSESRGATTRWLFAFVIAILSVHSAGAQTILLSHRSAAQFTSRD
jgi:hypothetical protein